VVKNTNDDIFTMNGYLLDDFNKRRANYDQLSGLLKKVNQTINLTSELQNKNKSEFINKCRSAIKEMDVDQVIKIMRGDVKLV